MAADHEFLPGDVVAVDVPNYGKREGLVIGTHLDTVGRQIVEVQFDRPGSYYHAWYPTVTRIRRYANNYPYHGHQRTLERHVHYY